jgi:catechol 2,3-dioxygenase-like lactoylglutathione lyase family enzyme
MSARAVAIEGGCLCGAIRYRAVGDATNRTLCHCASCRRAAGAPGVAWVTVPAGGFSIVHGAPATFRSSPKVLRTFCGACGTPLTYLHEDSAEGIDVTTCSLDAPEHFAPDDHTWASERVRWFEAASALPAYPHARATAGEAALPLRTAALVPELYVSDLARSLRFYVDAIGFAIDYARPEDRFASLALGAARLMLEQAPATQAADPAAFARGEWRTADLEPPYGRGINLELAVPDVARVSGRLAAAGHPILIDAHERVYRVGDGVVRVRQLLVADPDGYLIRPSERLGLPPVT